MLGRRKTEPGQAGPRAAKIPLPGLESNGSVRLRPNMVIDAKVDGRPVDDPIWVVTAHRNRKLTKGA